MSEDMKPIPVAAAKRIADEFGYHQVVIVARQIERRDRAAARQATEVRNG